MRRHGIGWCITIAKTPPGTIGTGNGCIGKRYRWAWAGCSGKLEGTGKPGHRYKPCCRVHTTIAAGSSKGSRISAYWCISVGRWGKGWCIAITKIPLIGNGAGSGGSIIELNSDGSRTRYRRCGSKACSYPRCYVYISIPAKYFGTPSVVCHFKSDRKIAGSVVNSQWILLGRSNAISKIPLPACDRAACGYWRKISELNTQRKATRLHISREIDRRRLIYGNILLAGKRIASVVIGYSKPDRICAGSKISSCGVS